MSITNITNIATVASGIIELIGTGKEVYEVTVNAMDAIEAKCVVRGEDLNKYAMYKAYLIGARYYEFSKALAMYTDIKDKIL